MIQPGFEQTGRELGEILASPIHKLGLHLEGSSLEPVVHQLYAELAARGLERFRPVCYLTDEWGCPDCEPVIGLPFYLAHPELQALEAAVNDLESEREIMMYMRHEAGHAFNYAYELYRTPEWQSLFGDFHSPYREVYKPRHFSRQFVRHLAGWYAQKHPDEDFAETFAVWLTPGSDWRERYAGWPALKKLEYVDRITGELAKVEPVRPLGHTELPVDEMDETVEQFYRDSTPEEVAELANLAVDADLRDIFGPGSSPSAIPASEVLSRHHRTMVDAVAYWSGVRRPLVKRLFRHLQERADALSLGAAPGNEVRAVAELVALATTLSMTYLAGEARPED